MSYRPASLCTVCSLAGHYDNPTLCHSRLYLPSGTKNLATDQMSLDFPRLGGSGQCFRRACTTAGHNSCASSGARQLASCYSASSSCPRGSTIMPSGQLITTFSFLLAGFAAVKPKRGSVGRPDPKSLSTFRSVHRVLDAQGI